MRPNLEQENAILWKLKSRREETYILLGYKYKPGTPYLTIYPKHTTIVIISNKGNTARREKQAPIARGTGWLVIILVGEGSQRAPWRMERLVSVNGSGIPNACVCGIFGGLLPNGSGMPGACIYSIFRGVLLRKRRGCVRVRSLGICALGRVAGSAKSESARGALDESERECTCLVWSLKANRLLTRLGVLLSSRPDVADLQA